ncbi:hypothetical protein AMTRI_Chr03g149210 [Amborella trichopoda]
MASGSDQSIEERAKLLQTLVSGPMNSSIKKLSASAKPFPCDEDFHFYANFNEFKIPVREISQKSESLMKDIGASKHLWNRTLTLPNDPDDSYDWLVDINDEIFERIDVSVDEFKKLQKKDGENGQRFEDFEDGFQLVYGKKNKKGNQIAEGRESRASDASLVYNGAKIASWDSKASKGRSQVPFHIPSIPRPQDTLGIVVDNSNQPFEHVWLQKSEDGSRFIHPLEKYSELEFVDKHLGDPEPIQPLPLENTPFTFVKEIDDLKELVIKLRNVNELAVDLEHNHYRSFQGMTCLMQISTRTEDYVVDTLKLRSHIGPQLRDAFADPSRKKVMHGADRDILWLQRDFGIYVCNLFDTHQASRVLQMERNSLEYLLRHFCGVTANKEYQNADWRLRPLPDEMIRYAREDTHYLLHLYDLMRSRLLSSSTDSGNGDALLVEVYKRSYDTCKKLYEKELLTDNSFLYIYGLHEADFDSKQLAVVAGLCEWRDQVARSEDESTGYVLPNKLLLEIARMMPTSMGKLRPLVKVRHPYVMKNIGAVISVIERSIENAPAFESICEQMRQARLEKEREENMQKEILDSEKVLNPDINQESYSEVTNMTSNGKMGDFGGAHLTVRVDPRIGLSHFSSSTIDSSALAGTNAERLSDRFVSKSLAGGFISSGSQQEDSSFGQEGRAEETKKEDHSSVGMHVDLKSPALAKPVNVATVQMLKKPSRAFGALLGNSASKRKINIDSKLSTWEQEKAESKVEKIKSSVTLPFHSFSGEITNLKPRPKEGPDQRESLPPKDNLTPIESNKPEGIILLEKETGLSPTNKDQSDSQTWLPQLEENNITEPMSLSDLSSSFQKCFQSLNQMKNPKQGAPSKGLSFGENGGSLEGFEPFDYEAARKQMKLRGKCIEGESGREMLPNKGESGRAQAKDRKVGSQEDDDIQGGRRRQVFPASGNRSATFRS